MNEEVQANKNVKESMHTYAKVDLKKKNPECMTLHISMNLHGPTPHTSLLDIPMPLNTKYNYL